MPEDQMITRAQMIIEPLLNDLQTIVNIDSGTYAKTGIDHVGTYLQQRFRTLGFSTYFEPQSVAGNNLVATRKGQNASGPRILLVGHMDTVFPDGEAQKRPFTLTEQGGVRIAKGPGVLDMKAGLLMGMYGVHLATEVATANYQNITFVFNSDEEIGSTASKPLIQELASQADVVLVLEPGRKLQNIVSVRKGIGFYRVEVQGVAAHAGVDPQNGRNAILELAHHIIALQAINGTIPGVTVNVGKIHGGERINVIPDHAYCEVDLRVADQPGLQAAEAALQRAIEHTTLQGTRVKLSGGIHSQPFEKSTRNSQLVQLVKEAGQTLGLQIEDVASGGASDANNTAIIGVATVDGLGATGGMAHSPDEYIELDTLPVRIALISKVITGIGDYYQGGQRL